MKIAALAHRSRNWKLSFNDTNTRTLICTYNNSNLMQYYSPLSIVFRISVEACAVASRVFLSFTSGDREGRENLTSNLSSAYGSSHINDSASGRSLARQPVGYYIPY